MTSPDARPLLAQFDATLAAVSDRIWQSSFEARLPAAVDQYIWTNILHKISEARQVLECMTPGTGQANAIREVSQRCTSDVLPILTLIEGNEACPDTVRQEARTAQQRITARLERLARHCSAYVDELAPLLANFAGFICAELSATAASPATDGCVHHSLRVWLEPTLPTGVPCEPILIRDGQDREEVIFDIFLDSDGAEIKEQRHALACRPGTPSGSLHFSAIPGATSDCVVYWVNVFQNNRLIQILELTATTIEMENRNDSAWNQSFH